jgi:tetratricopeptide (TPR) repeat protein
MEDSMSEKVRYLNSAVKSTGSNVITQVTTKVTTKAATSGFKLFSTSLGFQRIHVLLFILLSALLLAVLFILPSMVSAPEPEEISHDEAQTTSLPAPPDSPWSDAQLAKQRREAQEVLSKILSILKKLEAKKVSSWALKPYQHAMETAAAGDVHYRQRHFTDAQASYRHSLGLFETLIAQVDSVYQQQISQGQQAIIAQQVQPAITHYQLALALKPDSQVAQQGLQRALVQKIVIARVNDGLALMKRQQFNLAKQAFEQALAADDESIPAQKNLALAKQAIIDTLFSQAMSTGFKALNQQNYQPAIDAFAIASKIKPAANDAIEALIQAKNSHIQAQIAQQLQQAKHLEEQEQWQQANGHYQQLLTLDNSVVEARVGEIRSKVRAKLDSDLQKHLEQSARLTSQAVYQQARQLTQDAEGIKQPGSRLRGQINVLKQLLIAMKRPVSVALKSDNQTNVTLYKVGDLGLFKAKSIDLQPGQYTAIGTRKGYRDIRREFTLLPNEAVTTIVVQCEEKIRL